MINLQFYSFADRLPAHGDSIIYLYLHNELDMVGFGMRHTTAEAGWVELENGEYNGTSVCYNNDEDLTSVSDISPYDPSITLTYQLELIIDGYAVSASTKGYWMLASDWFSTLGISSTDACDDCTDWESA
jgi:hypothetical protein